MRAQFQYFALPPLAISLSSSGRSGAAGAAIVLLWRWRRCSPNWVAPYRSARYRLWRDASSSGSEPLARHRLLRPRCAVAASLRLAYGAVGGILFVALRHDSGGDLRRELRLLRRPRRSVHAAGNGILLSFPLIILALTVVAVMGGGRLECHPGDRDTDDPARRAWSCAAARWRCARCCSSKRR